MPRKTNIAVIAASQSDFEKYCISLVKYKATVVMLEPGPKDVSILPSSTAAILVFPGKTQSETLHVCQQLRKTSDLISIPLLLTVNRYDIVHAFVARQMENTGILITPFTDEELSETIELLANETTVTNR
ncbi:hypothetical protein ACFL6U_06340 [Planctomycetota bacterium]